MYLPVNSSVLFVELEEEILDFWKSKDIINKTLSLNTDSSNNFIFYDGPPGTNGKPHIGHMFQSALKDLWTRYKSMQGYRVIRKAGWDTHGLPVELRASKDLSLFSKKDIKEYGIEEFINYCNKVVLLYKRQWTSVISRFGRLLDFNNEYLTLTNDFIQSDWWILKQAFEKGFLYKGHKVLAYCPRLGTSLSNSEVSQGYKELTDLTLFVKFPLKNLQNTYFIVWTTTPWTLLGNVALAVNSSIEYVKVLSNNENYIFSKSSLSFLEKKGFIKDYVILDNFTGDKLKNISYEPLWNFFNSDKKWHYVLNDSYVTEDNGTGIVHLASYGEDDYRIICDNNLPLILHVNLEGKFTSECGEYSNRFFDEDMLDVKITKDLFKKNRLFAKEKIFHNYPCNYRTGTRLLYYPKSTWFLKTTAYKDKMIELNKDVNWHPKYVKEGRFGKWLENNIDWAISRERFWGTPLPIWNCISCGHQICIESIKELNKYSINNIPEDFNLHIPYIDQIKLKCPNCFDIMKREAEVLDCWFDAGAMPWGQIAYPHKKSSIEEYKNMYPADFICEGQDQTRGWFYAMHAISTMITGQSSYKNVICTDLVLDSKGQKMSKSLGNVVDPMDLINKYGADVLRWFAFSSNIIFQSVCFSENILKNIVKQIILPLWNCYSFFVTYANIDSFMIDNEDIPESLTNLLDIWIISEVQTLTDDVILALDSYNSLLAAQAISQFIDKLSNWYIRRSRRRFWKLEDDKDKYLAYHSLYYVLIKLIKILSPFLPFVTEVIYRNLMTSIKKDYPESIHLCKYPVSEKKYKNKKIEYEMNLIRHIVFLGRSLRNQHNIKIRQPLREMTIIFHSSNFNDKEIITRMMELIKDELNIKSINFLDDDSQIIDLDIIPNWKTIGPKFGKDVNKIASLIKNLSRKEINNLENNNYLNIISNNIEYSINLEDIIIKRKSIRKELLLKISSRLTIVLDTSISLELKQEGFAREFINKIQFMRKELKLEIMDQIRIDYSSNLLVKDSIEKWINFIKNETLALEINYHNKIISHTKSWDLNEEKVSILISKL